MSAAWNHQSLKLVRANKSDLFRASRGVGGNFRVGVERDDPATAGHAGGGVRAREQHSLRLERGRVDGQGDFLIFFNWVLIHFLRREA